MAEKKKKKKKKQGKTLKKLTKREELFVYYYIEKPSGAHAARMAGYSDKSARSQASRLLTKDNIKKAIEEGLSDREAELVAGASEILEYLTRVIRDKETEEVIVLKPNSEGQLDPVIETKKPYIKDKNKAAELLGKRYGIFKDQVEHSGDLDLNITVEYE